MDFVILDVKFSDKLYRELFLQRAVGASSHSHLTVCQLEWLWLTVTAKERIRQSKRSFQPCFPKAYID